MSRRTFLIKKSPLVFLRMMVIIQFFFAFLPLFFTFFLELEQQYANLPIAPNISFTLFLTVLVTLVQILIVALAFVAWYAPVYLIDRHTIRYQPGVLLEIRTLAALADVQHVAVRQNAIARRFNIGTLELQTSGPNPTAHIRDVSDPHNVAQEIEELAQTVRPLPALEQRPVAALLADGETQHVEFKSSLVWDYHQQKPNKALYEPVMKSLVAFMNSAGGTLLIGVADDGRVLGLQADYGTLKKSNSDGFENTFTMAFNKMIGVEFRPYVDVAFHTVDNGEICVIHARPAPEPVYLQHSGAESFYIRAGNSSQPLTISKAARYIQQRFGA